MSRFEKFKVDEVSIDEAEDDICFNAQDRFQGASCVGLNRLKYTTDIKLPTDFQKLLNGNFGDMCSFLCTLHPENMNKETLKYTW